MAATPPACNSQSSGCAPKQRIRSLPSSGGTVGRPDICRRGSSASLAEASTLGILAAIKPTIIPRPKHNKAANHQGDCLMESLLYPFATLRRSVLVDNAPEIGPPGQVFN